MYVAQLYDNFGNRCRRLTTQEYRENQAYHIITQWGLLNSLINNIVATILWYYQGYIPSCLVFPMISLELLLAWFLSQVLWVQRKKPLSTQVNSWHMSRSYTYIYNVIVSCIQKTLLNISNSRYISSFAMGHSSLIYARTLTRNFTLLYHSRYLLLTLQ